MFSHKDHSKDAKHAAEDAKHATTGHHATGHHATGHHATTGLDPAHAAKEHAKQEKEQAKMHAKELAEYEKNKPHVSYLNEPTRQELKAAAVTGTLPTQAAGHWENNVLNGAAVDTSYESNQENLARNGLRQGKPIIGQVAAGDRVAIEQQIQQGDVSLGIKGVELAGQRNVVATGAAGTTVNLQPGQQVTTHNESLGQVNAAPINPIQNAPVQQQVHAQQHQPNIHVHQPVVEAVRPVTHTTGMPVITPVVATHTTTEILPATTHLHTEHVRTAPLATSSTIHTSTHTGTAVGGHQVYDASAARAGAGAGAGTESKGLLRDHHTGVPGTHLPQDRVDNIPEGTYNKVREAEATNSGMSGQRL